MDYGDGDVQSYTFDPMGNRLSKVVNGISEGYTYDNANRLLTRGTASYTNDENGNTLTDGAANRSMTWDAQNRMASCTYAGQTSTFTYGSDGLRRRMVTGTNTTDYLLDGQNVVREIKNGVVNATYLNGPRGPEYKRDQNGAVQWYLYDGLGSVVGLVDESGNVTNARKYDVYGAPRNAQTGSAHCFVGRLGHTSDPETGLVYMRARYMDPATGRFVSEDPAQHGENWYAYCGNDPVDLSDPSGRFGLGELNIAVAIGEGLVAGGLDAALQALTTGEVDWGEVAIAGGVGAVAGGVGAYFRFAHYARTPLGRRVWREAGGSFGEYFAKFVGIGSKTSKQQMQLIPLWRSLVSGAGTRDFSLLYNMWVESHMVEEE